MGEESGRQRGGLHYGWIIAIMGVVTVLGALGLARFGYTMILPSMKEGLGLTDSQAGDLATANMIGYLVMAVTCGSLDLSLSVQWLPVRRRLSTVGWN